MFQGINEKLPTTLKMWTEWMKIRNSIPWHSSKTVVCVGKAAQGRDDRMIVNMLKKYYLLIHWLIYAKWILIEYQCIENKNAGIWENPSEQNMKGPWYYGTYIVALGN